MSLRVSIWKASVENLEGIKRALEEKSEHTLPYTNALGFISQVFWSWMAQAVVEAALITFVPLFLLKGGRGDQGTEQSLFMFGATSFTLVVLLANSKACSRGRKSWTVLSSPRNESGHSSASYARQQFVESFVQSCAMR